MIEASEVKTDCLALAWLLLHRPSFALLVHLNLFVCCVLASCLSLCGCG
jgi:hypothetical protein